MSTVALLPGLYVNARALIDRGPFQVWRPSEPAGRGRRRDLAARLGVPVFIERDQVWCLRAPGDDDGEPYVPAERPTLHRAAIREGIRALAAQRGFDPWFGLRGAVHCAPADEPPVVHGPVLIRPVLKLLVVGLSEQRLPALVARYERPGRFAAALADPDMRRFALGERAVRIAGDGPRSGEVEGFDGPLVLLRAGRRVLGQPSTDYALAATPALVQAVVPEATDTIQDLYTAARSLLPTGQPDQYALQERHQRAAELLARLGDAIPMPGGGSVAIDPAPVQIRVRER